MEPFVGEIRLFAFGRVPGGWALCDGSILQIQTYQALYILLGNTYGGTAPTTFALPDLRGRVPLCANPADTAQGTKGGAETVTLTAAQLPQHNHTVAAFSTAADALNPNSSFPAVLSNPGTSSATIPNMFIPPPGNLNNQVALNSAAVGSIGGGTAHENRQPYVAMSYCIALAGVWPQRQ